MNFLATVDDGMPVSGAGSIDSSKILDDLMREFPGAADGLKAQPRRPAKPASPAEDALNPMVTEAIKRMAIAVSKIVASRSDDKWIMTAVEAESLAEPLHRVIEKYSPGMSAYADEVAVGMVLTMYMMARMDLDTVLAPVKVKVKETKKPPSGIVAADHPA